MRHDCREGGEGGGGGVKQALQRRTAGSAAMRVLSLFVYYVLLALIEVLVGAFN